MIEPTIYRTKPKTVEVVRITGTEEVARDAQVWIEGVSEYEASVMAFLESEYGKNRWGVIIEGDGTREAARPGQFLVHTDTRFHILHPGEFHTRYAPEATDAVPVPARPYIVASSYGHFRDYCFLNDISPARAIYLVEPDQLRGVRGAVVHLASVERPDWLTEELLAFGELDLVETTGSRG